MHILNLFLFFVVNNMTVHEGNKLHNWFDFLILVTKYSKVRKWNHYFSIFFKLLYGCKQFLAITLYLLIDQSCDTCLFIRFMSNFWSKINKWMSCNKNFLVCNRKNLVARNGDIYFGVESMIKYKIVICNCHQGYLSD